MATSDWTCDSCGAELPQPEAGCPECAEERTLDRSPSLPSIPGYRIERILGEGGMGIVYLATDLTLERSVGIKLLYSGSVEAKARFLREARAMANVRHPNIVPIYTFGETDEGAYLVMEYLAGGTLTKRLRVEGALGIEEALTTVQTIAGALEAAWKKGIVHRDVKPSNILMDEEGNVFVADFGLAKRLDAVADETLTGTGGFTGTPNYVAPEIIAGERADQRSDIYALGLVLYELLTGERAFRGNTPASVIAKQVYGAMPDLREACPEAPAALARLVEDMAAKDRNARVQSYEELRRRLGATELRGKPKKTTIFMDRHDISDVTAEDVAEAHQKDLALQDKYGVKALTYWFDAERGTTFCLMEGPDRESISKLHHEAHGLVPHEIIEVETGAVQGFLGRIADPASAAAEPIGESGFRTVMVLSVTNVPALSAELGDDGAMEALGKLNTVLRRVLGRHDGREVKRLTDGFLASFSTASRAVACAIGMQKAVGERSEDATPIHIKIGINAGEPVARSDDLFGTTVNVASAICAHAAPDEILVSQVIRDLCLGKKLPFQEGGELTLEGLSESVRLYAVAWQDGKA